MAVGAATDPSRRRSRMWSLVILGGMALAAAAEGRSARRRRRAHVAGHARMSDAQYLAELALPAARRDVGLAFRRAMAEAAGVPTETVHPGDSMAHLCALGFDGLDAIEMILPLERRLGVRINDRKATAALAAKLTLTMTFADFVRCYVWRWDSIVE
jgi:acyl carrier protein